MKEKGGSHQFLSETEKQFLMKYDIEVPTTLLKDEVLAKQRVIFAMDNESEIKKRGIEDDGGGGGEGHDHNDGGGHDDIPPKQQLNRMKSFYSFPILQNTDGSANPLDNLNQFEEEIHKKQGNGKEGDDGGEEGADAGKGVEGEGEGNEEEIEYFNPTKQNIIRKVVDFSEENRKDKDRLQALFTNKTFLTETKSFPVSMFISKPDIDDIDIDLDDDPELLQLKLGIYI